MPSGAPPRSVLVVVDTIPLRERVAAPGILPVPESTSDLTWRPASNADLDAALDCVRAAGAVDHPQFVTTREELEQDFGHSYVSLEHDSLLALDAAGQVLAYGLTVLSPSQDTLVRSFLDGAVRPSARGRGIGRELLAWQEARALQQFATSKRTLPGWMVLWSDARATSTVRLAERAGFRIARYFLELRRELSEPIPPRLLEGFEIVPFDATLTEAVRLARNDAFRDHWGSQPTTEEDWNEAIARAVFRPELSFLALAPNGEVAGFVLCEVNEEDFEPQGFSSAYIELVGVPRAFRRLGIAPALLSHTLAAVAQAGLEKAVLDVDSDNPSGALGLYTGLGFVEANRSLQLNKVF